MRLYFKSQVMNEILGNVQGAMPKVLNNVMPDATGPSMPFIKKWIVIGVMMN